MNQPFTPAIRPRTLANVLADLREAHGDQQQAMSDLRCAQDSTKASDDADDRVTEADTRVEDLRGEFEAVFVEATGLTVEDFRKAIEGALL
jgi:hypothetical protein